MNRAVCTICADYLICENSVSCPCGHTFHHECIHRWKQQSSTCPQCRMKFKNTTKLFFELSSADRAEGDPAELRNEVTELKLKIRVRDTSIGTLEKENNVYANERKVKDGEMKTVNKLLDNALGTNDALKKQLSYCEKFKSDSKKLKIELENLQKKESSYRNIQALVDTERHDIDTTIKNFKESPDSFNQIVTSYVLLKKEFDRLKESKRVMENDRKTYRKKAEAASREAYECKEQLKTVTTDVESLTQINRSLTEKMTKLEESYNSTTPRSNAIKRLLRENPAPIDLKRQCLTSTPSLCNSLGNHSSTNKTADESLILFDDDAKAEHESVDENFDRYEKRDSGYGGGSCNDDCAEDLDLDAEEAIKIADEFGLHYVETTSSTSDRQPFKELSKTTKMKSNFVSNKSTRTLAKQITQSNTSDLPHFRQGFNGMGGQSKTLIIPKRTGSYVKPLPSNNAKKSGLGFMKIPKNNSKITKFVVSNSKFTSSIQLSP